jgi:hypothetical protein
VNRPTENLDDLFRAEDDRLAVEASTPERIAADEELRRRSTEKSERELEALRASGGIDEGGDEEEECPECGALNPPGDVCWQCEAEETGA